MENLLKSLIRVTIRYRWPVLALLCLATVVLAHAATRLQVNNDHATWLPGHDEVAKLLRQVDDEFSSNVMVFTVIDFSDRGVFDSGSLALIDRITRALDGMEELFNVTSITNIIDIRKTRDGIEVGELMTEIPQTAEELEALKRYVLSKEMYVNAIVSSDCTYTALMANIVSTGDEVAVAGKIFRAVSDLAGDRPHYFGGDPAVNYYMNEYMYRDMRLLVPLIVVVMVFVLAFGLRRVTGVVFPLTLVALSIVWTFGLMSFFLFPANILSPAVAVLLIALGSDYAVHIYNHYLKRGDILTSAPEIALPVIMSAMTTIAGLLAFATTRIEVMQNFGFELAFGLGSACILSIVLLTIGICVFGIKASPGRDNTCDTEHVFSRVMVRTGSLVHDHARAIIAVAFIGLVTMAYGVTRIRTNVDFIGELPEESSPRQGCNILVEHFNGMYPFNLYVQGDIEDPAVMNAMSYLENYLRSEDAVNGFTSLNSLIAEENWLLNGVYAIPGTRQGIANLWFLLEGQEILKTFVTSDRHKGLVNSIVRESSTGGMSRLSGRLGAFLDRHASNTVVTIDPGQLSDKGRMALDALRIDRAASQLTWLSGFYDRLHAVEASSFRDRITAAMPVPEDSVDWAPVWDEAATYLEEETVEILPAGLIGRLIDALRAGPDKLNTPGTARSLEGMIVGSGQMDVQDARMTVAGLLGRIDFAARLGKVAVLRTSYSDIIPPALADNKDFLKRSDGVLWELLADRPSFFSRQVASVPGLATAVVASAPVKIDQAGMPETIRVVVRLLISSQLQSLVIASLIVLVLVSLTQRSIRRGAISLLSVLVPLVFILGFMGMADIPLDMGTVLCGALIIGLGIDGSIHFLHYFRRLNTQGIVGREALQLTMGHVGRAVLTANSTTFCGFVVLLLSQTTAVRNFAAVNSMAIFLVTLSILTLLPALITITHLGDRRDTGSDA